LSIEKRRQRGAVLVLIVRPASSASTPSKALGVFHIHGGGMDRCDYWAGVDNFVYSVKTLGFVAASVEYGLAPEI